MEQNWHYGYFFHCGTGLRLLFFNGILSIGLIFPACASHTTYMPIRQLGGLARIPAAVAVAARHIHIIRGRKVMLDFDLAELYRVATKVFNQAVKRNRRRFPADFMFQLSAEEAGCLRSQIVTSKEGRGGRRYRPYAFTQEGVAMLSSVLNSPRAVEVNIAIMRAFVAMRETALTYSSLARKLEELVKRCDRHDGNIRLVFDTLKRLVAAPAPHRRRIGFVGQ